jgi:hypothetical protein
MAHVGIGVSIRIVVGCRFGLLLLSRICLLGWLSTAALYLAASLLKSTYKYQSSCQETLQLRLTVCKVRLFLGDRAGSFSSSLGGPCHPNGTYGSSSPSWASRVTSEGGLAARLVLGGASMNDNGRCSRLHPSSSRVTPLAVLGRLHSQKACNSIDIHFEPPSTN